MMKASKAPGSFEPGALYVLKVNFNESVWDRAAGERRCRKYTGFQQNYLTSGFALQLLKDMDVEGRLTVQCLQLLHPLHARPGGFPAVGRHLEQGADIRRGG